MRERIRTVIIGAGQAGLAVSRHLVAASEPHVILERGRLAERWRSERWDSFRLLSPSWFARLPGFGGPPHDPDGFMTAPEVVRFFESFADSFGAPVRSGVEVEAVEAAEEPGRLLVRCAQDRTIVARNVVVATGPDHHPVIPASASRLDPEVFQVHSCQYRNPGQLPPGAVLVVGTGPSGQQIAEELYQTGRRVYLSVGRFTKIPRRYRGRDTTWWMDEMGDFDRTVDSLDVEARRMPRYALTGNRGGHDLDLHSFAEDGVVLLGRVRGLQGKQARFAPDLDERLAEAEAGMEHFKRRVDEHLERRGSRAPPPDPPLPRPRFGRDPILGLDLKREGITTVLWATGFGTDLSWIELPIFGEGGEPRHVRGVTAHPGLFLIGLRWLYKFQSSFIRGAAEDAAHIAERLLEARPEEASYR